MSNFHYLALTGGLRRFRFFSSGSYEFTLTVNDRISKRQDSIKKNFTVIEFKPRLIQGKSFLAYYDDDSSDCYERKSGKFHTSEIACVKPRITGFETVADGTLWFEMDHSILDSSGQLIDQRKNIFEERG